MSNRTYVWDRFIRSFHGLLVLLFTVSYLTGEDQSWLHIYSGYTVLALILLRVIWGVIGSKHARFKGFIFTPAAMIGYMQSIFKGNPKQYLGHNPLGGLMVVALLLMLVITSISGLKLYAVEEGKGPFAGSPHISLVSVAYADSDDDHEEDDFWEEIHEASANLMILLIVLHVAGVALSSRIHNESLIRSMITGYKIRK